MLNRLDTFCERAGVPWRGDPDCGVGALEREQRTFKLAGFLQAMSEREVEQHPVLRTQVTAQRSHIKLVQLVLAQRHRLQVGQRKPRAADLPIHGNQAATVCGSGLGIAQCFMTARALQQGNRSVAIQSPRRFDGMQCLLVPALTVELGTELQPVCGLAFTGRSTLKTRLGLEEIVIVGLCGSQQEPKRKVVSAQFNRPAQDSAGLRPRAVFHMQHCRPAQQFRMLRCLLKQSAQLKCKTEPITRKMKTNDLAHLYGVCGSQSTQSLAQLGGIRLAAGSVCRGHLHGSIMP